MNKTESPITIYIPQRWKKEDKEKEEKKDKNCTNNKDNSRYVVEITCLIYT